MSRHIVACFCACLGCSLDTPGLSDKFWPQPGLLARELGLHFALPLLSASSKQEEPGDKLLSATRVCLLRVLHSHGSHLST